MSIFRYNFNGVQNQDLKKYLHSKLDFEKWEESIAQDAIVAHYRHFSKISYGFPMPKNHFIIMHQKLIFKLPLVKLFEKLENINKIKDKVDFV